MRGRVAWSLSVGVALFIVLLGAAVLYSTVDDASEVTAEAAGLVSAVVGGVVGALAVYLGGSDADLEVEDKGVGSSPPPALPTEDETRGPEDSVVLDV